jgi:hypothetical protein
MKTGLLVMSNEIDCLKAFNKAVDGFWKAANDKADKSELMMAADEVFLARDEIPNEVLARKQWNEVIEDVADVSSFLDSKGITMSSSAQTTSTGRRTYRPVYKTRFDS